MSFLRSLRLNLYGFILALGICQNGLTAGLAPAAIWDRGYRSVLSNASHFLAYYSSAASIVSFGTWIWVSVLVAYNDRKRSNHPLARAMPHFISSMVLSVVWLILGSLLLSETRFSCPNMPGPEARITTWCAISITTGSLGLIMSLLCSYLEFPTRVSISRGQKSLLAAIAAAIIYRSARQSPLGLKSSVVAQDGNDPGPMKGRLPTATKIRTTLYSLVIIFGFAVTPFGVIHLIVSYEAILQAFASLSVALATISWIWASVLLSYNRRPSTTRMLTRASTHFYTTINLATLELACGIMILSQTKASKSRNGTQDLCDWAINGWCWVHGVNAGLTLVLSMILFMCAGYVYVRTRKGGSLSRSNVAEFDGEGPENLNRNENFKMNDLRT
ncbi:hypothetical protein PM082_011776 [Marasmius tenuissimus]|nr:hypothetical protein PM082_011776 [Marasmius tenuissimus]